MCDPVEAYYREAREKARGDTIAGRAIQALAREEAKARAVEVARRRIDSRKCEDLKNIEARICTGDTIGDALKRALPYLSETARSTARKLLALEGL